MRFLGESYDMTYNISKLIEDLAFPRYQSPDSPNIFAFSYKDEFPKTGWDVYQDWGMYEFIRQGIDVSDYKSNFTLFQDNLSNDINPDYPKKLIIPAGISSQEVSVVARYRKRKAFPVLVYYFNHFTSSIWRMSHISNTNIQRCHEDIKYLQSITETNHNKVLKSILIDTR